MHAQHIDAATMERIVLGDCSSAERYAAMYHVRSCRYCLERCQALGGHVVATWQQTVDFEVRRHESTRAQWLPAIRRIQLPRFALPEFAIPVVSNSWARGGAIAAAAALSLMLITSPELRQQLSDPNRPHRTASPSMSSHQVRTPSPGTVDESNTAIQESDAAIPSVDVTPETATGSAPPQPESRPVNRRVKLASVSIQNQPTNLQYFQPPAAPRKRIQPAHNVVDIAPPPAIRPQLQVSPALLAQVDVDELPPPKRSKFVSFWHRTGSGVKNALGLLR